MMLTLFSDATLAEIQAASVIFAVLVLILGFVGIAAADGDREDGDNAQRND